MRVESVLVTAASPRFPQAALGSAVFLPFVVVLAVWLLITLRYVPETKGRTIAQIQARPHAQEMLCAKETCSPRGSTSAHSHSLDPMDKRIYPRCRDLSRSSTAAQAPTAASLRHEPASRSRRRWNLRASRAERSMSRSKTSRRNAARCAWDCTAAHGIAYPPGGGEPLIMAPRCEAVTSARGRARSREALELCARRQPVLVAVRSGRGDSK